MDLTPYLDPVAKATFTAALPIALSLSGWALRQAQQRLHISLSSQIQAAVAAETEAIVDVGVGWGRAKLASGQMQLAHVTTGNQHIDQIATATLAMLSGQARASGITADDIARRVVAGIGHALGDDPQVPTVGQPTSPAGAESVSTSAPASGAAGAPA